MLRITCLLFLVLTYFHVGNTAFPKNYGRIESLPVSGDIGEALLLTPLIEQNKIEEAQAAAKVSFSEFKHVESYSGYLTVDKAYNSNIFFWFFPAQNDYENAPVLLWLQGGPGVSSLFALFYENGPFILKTEHEVRMRNETWTTDHSVIYIDNPVGTGFSFTDGGYAQNQTKVGEDLHEALKQFFTLFPKLQNNPFFITGESYAGKYVPAAAYTILNKNSDENLKINLKGIAIGNGLSDPENQLLYSDYLYQIGLIDSNGRKKMHDLEQWGKLYIQLGKWDKAFEIFNFLVLGDLTEETTVFKNLTGFDNHYNFLYPVNPVNRSNLGKFLQRDNVRKAIHTGNMTYSDGKTVEENLSEDFMKSVAPWVSEILSNIRVLLYNGQLDIIVAYPLTVNYLQNLKFDGSDEYKTAERYKWYVGDDLAGYVKRAGKLTELLVRNAGHLVPSDQPQWALDMITKFTRNIEFH
ncbi:hypothetical protein JTB14_025776 [Gonioctena quinquepunctata]|nr:hypothetical protein JTB14_025776 [Gonioctena quinquepunctata]